MSSHIFQGVGPQYPAKLVGSWESLTLNCGAGVALWSGHIFKVWAPMTQEVVGSWESPTLNCRASAALMSSHIFARCGASIAGEAVESWESPH